ncbi:amidohydrolase [Rhodothalassium salexigens]|uniref:amidohydrolase n=1 Tax=Rhodothalassium salexigens TaxID=1086 RepID=UPI001911E05C|nr:amidohydrolase [Rhodothalassium salexigens]MBK5910838.1 amidohydrolase [Rhodothalassium salexigens]
MGLSHRLAGAALALMAGTTATAATAAAQDSADLIIRGGPIYTADDAQPQAEALAVRDGVLVHVGPAAGLAALTGPDTRVIDLDGAAAYPGFVDGHAHLLGIGQREMTLNLDDAGSLAAMVDKVAEAVAAAEPGAVVYGRGWIETHWPEDRFPTAADLDPIAPDNPVYLVRADGHAAVVNSAALAAVGIDARTEAPEGGEILRDPAGRPTGMLIDTAMGLAGELAPAMTGPDTEPGLVKAGEVYTARGWTGIHNMSVAYDRVARLERLSDAGRLRLRVYNSVDKQDADQLFDSGPRRSANGLVETRAVKLYADGALGSRGARLLAPYSDRPDTRGLFLDRRDDVIDLFTRGLRAGIQMNTHAIGDAANRAVLDWYAEAFKAVPPEARAVAVPRWRIEHAQIVDPADIPRFAALGVIPAMQPSHAIGDLHFAADRLGLDRLAGAYAWARFVETGAPVVGGSDAPVEAGEPMVEFYAAVARRDLSGFQGEGWHPELAVSRDVALKMFTLWPALGAFQEQRLGSLSVGKRADITVFDADIMTVAEDRLPHVEAVMTIVDGQVVWRRQP